jgi:hypothetical protein
MPMEANTTVFQRMVEPNEGAFCILVPQGWQVEGGILRVDPMMQTQSAQSIAAKVDFTVKRDEAGSVMIRWLPDVLYCDMRMSPAGQMGLFPPGSNYQGMPVYPLVPAQDFLTHMVFPQIHPWAEEVRVVEQRNLPQIAQSYQQRLAGLPFPAGFSYDAGVVAFSYGEGGTCYLEKAFTVIENMGPMAGGMWGNKETLLLRAPAEQFERWQPVLSHVQRSIELNSEWIAQEIEGQIWRSGIFRQVQQASIARDRKMLEIQHQIQEIDRQMVEHQQRTNAEIQNDAFLTLMEQEEYLNPYTQEVEVGSNQWDYRWVTADGDELYTDEQDIDPNVDGCLNRSDWQHTPVRPRFPQ